MYSVCIVNDWAWFFSYVLESLKYCSSAKGKESQLPHGSRQVLHLDVLAKK